MNPLVSVNLVVQNGDKYIKECLEAVLNQTYKNIEVLIFDNDSKDDTLKIAGDIKKRSSYSFRILRNNRNYGFGGGQNRVFKFSKGKYIIGLCVDVILDKDFVKESIKLLEKNPKIGAVQGKTYRADWSGNKFKPLNIIDTTGFQIFKSRRLINRGHGEEDKGQYNKVEEIFSQEGSAPVFRKKTLEHIMINDQFLDEDLFWYATDIDLGWRMRLAGWKIFYNPKLIAYHDRPTTKRLSKDYLDFIRMRKNVPAERKRLDYRNWRLVIIKNDFYCNLLRDFLPFLLREFKLFLYILFFETKTLSVIPAFFWLLPKMLKKRKIIMKNRKISNKEMGKWFK